MRWGHRPALLGALIGACTLPTTGITDDATPGPGGDGGLDAGVRESGVSCGDGVAEPPEGCDGDDLRGQTCASSGFDSGELGCTPDCQLDVSRCVRCPDPCDPAGDARCQVGRRQRCTVDTPSCTRWMDEEDCAAVGALCRPGGVSCFGGDGSSCASPAPAVPLPFRKMGAAFTAEHTDAHTFAGDGCPSRAGAELVIGANLAAGQTVRLSERGPLDASLSVLGVCGDGEACARATVDESPGLTFTAPSDGLYFFVVEGPSSGSQAYDVVLEEAPPGNLCTDPLEAVALPTRRMGANIDAELTDDHDFDPGTCIQGNGPQLVFARTMAAGETARVSERGPLDTYLHVLGTCEDGASCLRSEDREASGLSFTAPADGTYFFVVEAVSTSGSRTFDAVLDAPPPGNLCDDPLPAGSLPVRASGSNIDVDFTDDHRLAGTGCLSHDGAEIVMARALAPLEVVRMRELGPIDSHLHVLRGSCDDATACLRSEDREAQGLTFTAPGADVYYFVFEAESFSGSRSYDAVLDAPPDGNVCAAPVDASTLASVTSGAELHLDYSDEHTFTDPSCAGGGTTEIVVARDMAAAETVRFRETAGADVTLRVLGSCSDAAPCLRNETDEASGLSFSAPTAGRYYFVAESTGPGGSRTYSVALEATPSGQTCLDPRVVTSDVTIAGPSFTAFTDDHFFSGAGCVGTTGAELILRRTLAAGQQVTLTESESLDVTLSVIEGACSDTATCLRSTTSPETLSFMAPRAGVYTFVVEASGTSARPYNVQLTSP